MAPVTHLDECSDYFSSFDLPKENSLALIYMSFSFLLFEWYKYKF